MSPDPTSVPDALVEEARGDWSGFKGAHYHLAFAAYSLLCEGTGSTSFYAGNDLLNTRADPNTLFHARLQQSSHPQQDEWVQLKSGDSPWTISALLSEKLLLTFILDAFLSEAGGRSWSVRLVSPAPVRSKKLESFVRDPAQHSGLKEQFDAILSEAQSECSKNASSPVSLSAIEELAKRVLLHIAECKPLPLDLIESQIRESLLSLYPNQRTKYQILQALEGALLHIAGGGDGRPVTVSLATLEQETGIPLRPQFPLETDPVQACQAQVESACSRWSPALCIERPHVTARLEDFLRSDQTLFVLAGDSGTGKSWLCRQWAMQHRHGTLRLLLPAADLSSSDPLSLLAAKSLREWAPTHMNGAEIWQRLQAAAAAPSAEPLVVIFDDLPLPDPPASFVQRLELLCQEAARRRVKLVITARQSIWQRIHLPGDVFSPYLFRPGGSLEQASLYSAELPTLSAGEVEKVLDRWFPTDASLVRHLARLLRQPAYAPLRNGYLLSEFLEQVVAGAAPPPVVDIDGLLDAAARRHLGSVARAVSDTDSAELREALEALTQRLWQGRRGGVRIREAKVLLDKFVPGKGAAVYSRLVAEDILTGAGDKDRPEGYVAFANPQFGDRLTARLLAGRITRGEADALLCGMVPGQDDGVMTALVRGAIAAADPLDWAEQTLERDPTWLHALSEGLVQRTEVDIPRLCALLTAWANRGESHALWNACRALGRLAGRAPFARRWIAELYLDEEQRQRFKGQIALGAALCVAPRWAAPVISLRLRRDIARPKEMSENRTRFDFLRGALRPLEQIDSQEAARVARPLLRRMADWDARQHSGEPRDVREMLEDRLDELRGRVALFDESEDLDALLRELEADEPDVRARASRALLPISFERPQRIRAAVLRQAARERSGARAHVLQLLVPLAEVESNVDAVLDALSACSTLDGKGAGMTLVLLTRLAALRPERVRALLPGRLSAEMPRRVQAVLGDLLAHAW